MDTSLFSLLLKGGWTMLPLAVCSLAAVTVLVQKAIQFQMERVGVRDALNLIAAYDGSGELEELAEACQATQSPLGEAMALCARTLGRTPERTEDEVQRFATVELDRLERWLPLLSFIAQAAPLFGLLGTVVGMVQLFVAMGATGSRIETGMLASGIWQALLTTAAGLMIAIPALGGHVWLMRRVDALRIRMEDGAGRILTSYAALHARDGE